MTTDRPQTAQGRSLITAAAAGIMATAITGITDRLLDNLVSKQQKKRDRRVRKGTAHELAGPYFAGKILGRRLNKREQKRAQAVFSIVYSIAWGAIYAGARRRMPQVTRSAGLPFAVPFFLACDGILAPILGVSPNLCRVPWQPSAKELANHIVWTAAAEMVHQAADAFIEPEPGPT